MSKMSFWNQFIGSVLRIDYYLILVKCSVSKAITYLIILTFIIGLLPGIQMLLSFNSAVDFLAKEMEGDSPDFIFANGALTVNAPMPYIINKEEDALFIVDTSGKSDESILKDYKKGIFIGKDKIVTKKNVFETKNYDLEKFRKFALTKADVVKYLPWSKWINLFVELVGYISGVIINLVAALIVGICGWIVSKIMSAPIKCKDLYKISIYTLTLPLLLEWAKDLYTIDIPLFGICFYIISIVYIIAVLKKLKFKHTEETMEI